jgi:hypothetical protein
MFYSKGCSIYFKVFHSCSEQTVVRAAARRGRRRAVLPTMAAGLPPPTVRQALVHAASYITTRDQAAHVLQVDMRPLVIHLLAGLENAGIERAVVTLGHHADQLAECIVAYGARPAGPPAPRRSLAGDLRVRSSLRPPPTQRVLAVPCL